MSVFSSVNSSVWAKIVLCLIIFAIDMTGIITPIYFLTWFKDQKRMAIIKCIAGGVLLGTSSLQLLYEAEKSEMEYERFDVNFPFIHFISGMGFIITMTVQLIIHLISSRNKSFDYSDNAFQMETDSNEMEEISEVPETKPVTTIKNFPYLLFSVLIAESIISGTTMGIQDKIPGIVIVFIAIASHDWIEGLILTLSFMGSGSNIYFTRSKIISYGFIFSLSTPMGIITGCILNYIIPSDYIITIASGFMAFTSGAFLYMSVVEIISKEIADIGSTFSNFENNDIYAHDVKRSILKISAIIFGFVISSIAVFVLTIV
jgi:zinc transporter ZupT